MNHSNEAPIEISIVINGERKFLQLQFKCNPDDFAKKKQPKEISDYISVMRLKINQALSEMAMENVAVTADSLRDYLRTGGVKSYTIENLFNDWLSILKKRVGNDLTQSAYRKYELTRDLFYSEFNKNTDVNSILPKDMENFYMTLKQKYQANSSASYMAKVKTCIMFGIANNKIKVNPFQTIKIKREKKEIQYLTETEVQRIKATEMPCKALERVRDTFLLQCFCGLAYSDMECLKKEDIQQSENGVWFISKPRVKTGVNYTAVIFPEGVELLKKYNFNMPIISNQKTNAALKAIARECSIDKNVASHLGRKTYGNFLLNGYNGSKPMSIEVTAKCMGHSDCKTTARYYASMHQDTVVSEFAKALF